MNSPIFCSRLSQDNVDAEGTDVACVISVRHGSDQQIHGSPNEKAENAASTRWNIKFTIWLFVT